jgi:hypothetical protein
MSIGEQTAITLRASYMQAIDVLINTQSSEASRRLARAQIAYCERVLPILEKAFPKTA